MISHTFKRMKRYVDCLMEISKPTFLIHFPRHYSQQCKLTNNFVEKYAKGRQFKESRRERTAKKNVINQEVYAIVQHALYMILQEYKDRKIIARNDTSDYYKHEKIKDLQEIDKLVLDESPKE